MSILRYLWAAADVLILEERVSKTTAELTIAQQAAERRNRALKSANMELSAVKAELAAATVLIDPVFSPIVYVERTVSAIAVAHVFSRLQLGVCAGVEAGPRAPCHLLKWVAFAPVLVLAAPVMVQRVHEVKVLVSRE